MLVVGGNSYGLEGEEIGLCCYNRGATAYFSIEEFEILPALVFSACT